MTSPVARDRIDRQTRANAIERLLALPEVKLARDLLEGGVLDSEGGIPDPATPDDFINYAISIAERPRCAVKFSTFSGSCMRLAGHTGKHFTAEESGPRMFVWTHPLEGDAADNLALAEAAAREQEKLDSSGCSDPPTDSQPQAEFGTSPAPGGPE